MKKNNRNKYDLQRTTRTNESTQTNKQTNQAKKKKSSVCVSQIVVWDFLSANSE